MAKMAGLWQFCLLKLILVFVFILRLEAVTVNPAPCPTNKIAPHKRTTRWDHHRARTFGSFYNLFGPTGFADDGLVEKPQEDAPDDCGDIEDYDENDLSSVTQQSQRRQGHRDTRFFNGGSFGFLYPFHGQEYQTTKKPPVTFSPILPSYPPTRPPYASGGVFGDNFYRPPLAQKPSVHVKPVHDGIQESQITYKPGLVGAPSGLVVGASQVTPTKYPPSETTSQKKPHYVNSARFPPHTTQASSTTSKRPRPKKLNCDDNQNPYLEALRLRQWKSVQQYVEVRPGAFLYYWLYYADGTSDGADRKPLIIWIQGGPGLAATGIANFAEIGPLNMDLQPRNHTWVNGRNVLLIDHPVGTGFSYATDSSLLVKSDKEAAKDLLRVIKAFFRRHKEFRKTPTYLFGQSYGGKLCPRLGYYLHTAIEKKRVKINLKGIGIGSGWVDPKQSTLAHINFLYYMGVIDIRTYEKTMKLVQKLCYYIDRKEYISADRLDNHIYKIINTEAGMLINFNNINQPSPYPALDKLEIKVNKFVKPTLANVNQSMHWSYISESVFQSLNDSFFVPSSNFLEMILNKTTLKVAVYNGNLDIVTPLAGASNWVHMLKWSGAQEFKYAKRIQIRGYRNGFYKSAQTLSFWSVFGAGHWVPEENPEAMSQILEHIMS
ncbi:retinoid-inducible serine carboxypeptidase-like [Epargyreus clarus]|uniref:retinoid-inducible serine carboxypeptidase-like n=1 Tax=Epargyreus clarus TaxID=520877 RepID=UPI003C2FBFA4